MTPLSSFGVSSDRVASTPYIAGFMEGRSCDESGSFFSSEVVGAGSEGRLLELDGSELGFLWKLDAGWEDVSEGEVLIGFNRDIPCVSEGWLNAPCLGNEGERRNGWDMNFFSLSRRDLGRGGELDLPPDCVRWEGIGGLGSDSVALVRGDSGRPRNGEAIPVASCEMAEESLLIHQGNSIDTASVLKGPIPNDRTRGGWEL